MKMVKGIEVNERMICEITEVKEMAVVTGATGSMWEPLAKHLDGISVTFSCENTANGWFVWKRHAGLNFEVLCITTHHLVCVLSCIIHSWCAVHVWHSVASG